MPTPKKKISRARRDKRRYNGHNALVPPTVTTCPSCNGSRRPHRVCQCGYYDSKLVIEVAPAQEA